MQQQTNSMNDSGEFQEVETNYSGRLSFVSSQPAMIPSSRCMLSRDKRLPFDTWSALGLQENVFGNQFSTCGSHRYPSQVIHYFARDDEQNKGTLPMPTCARRPSTMSSLMLVEFPQNPMVGQQRQQISELQFDKFPAPLSFLVWKIRFKKTSDYLF